MTSRTSSVAFVLVKLSIEEQDHFLFIRHVKWGDWGLVGGHVEIGEEGDWLATARREAEEELTPLTDGTDFNLHSLSDTVSWGPVASRSAHGQPTRYVARYFALSFTQHPTTLLPRLDPNEFLLVPQSHLTSEQWDEDITDTLRQLVEALPRGLLSVPYAWHGDLVAQELGVPARPFGSRDAPTQRRRVMVSA